MQSIPGAPHGVCNTAHLRRNGINRAMLRKSLNTGSLLALRAGWYADESAHPWVVSAVTAGGHLSGLHRLKLIAPEIWLPERATWNLFAHTPSRCTLPGARVRSRPKLSGEDLSFGVVPIEVALRHGLTDLALEQAVAVVDSLLRVARLRPRYRTAGLVDAQRILHELQRTAAGRRILRYTNLSAESGLESIVRVLLELAGHHVETQVLLPNGQRVDLLVDGVLAVELDGRTHFEKAQFESDYRKDMIASARGYATVRYTYEQVHRHWPDVLQDIERRISRHDGGR